MSASKKPPIARHEGRAPGALGGSSSLEAHSAVAALAHALVARWRDPVHYADLAPMRRLGRAAALRTFAGGNSFRNSRSQSSRDMYRGTG